ncbi:pyridoxamine 5'-phosphate oxidase family protein [bacterium]|nr:pyridoxamine 5'-phosphate oxidase family protein [bacterium]
MKIISDQIRKSKCRIHDKETIEAMIKKAVICRLGLVDEDRAYIVPMNFGYDSGVLYFHCGAEGRKIDCLKKRPGVSFEIDVLHDLKAGELACGWDALYDCVMGRGEASFITDREQKRHALNMIMRQVSGKTWEFPDEKIDKTTIIAVEIKTVSAKSTIKQEQE